MRGTSDDDLNGTDHLATGGDTGGNNPPTLLSLLALEPDAINRSSTLDHKSIEPCLIAKEHRERSKSLKLPIFQWSCHDYSIERKHLSASAGPLFRVWMLPQTKHANNSDKRPYRQHYEGIAPRHKVDQQRQQLNSHRGQWDTRTGLHSQHCSNAVWRCQFRDARGKLCRVCNDCYAPNKATN